MRGLLYTNPRAHAPVRVFFRAVILLWLVLAALRLLFFIWQWPVYDVLGAELGWPVLLKAWGIGLRFDGRWAAFLSLPLLAVLFWPRMLTFGRAGFACLRPVVTVLYSVLFFALLLAYCADFAHYAYMGLRVNFAAAEELGDISEALRMVWQTYPVLRIVLGCVLLTLLLRYAFCRAIAGFEWIEGPAWQRALKCLACLIVLTLLIMGQISSNFFPLRWSQAYFSGSLPVASLGINPLQNVWDTRPNRGRGTYDAAIVQHGMPAVRAYLGLPPQAAGAANSEGIAPLIRHVPGRADSTRPNVVIIVVESLSTHLSSFFSPKLQSTPFTKELAEHSLYFPNYYASARTTAKAVFSLLTGIPDANRSFSTSSRDPNVVDQHIIWRDFTDYAKMYCIGGNANWANIRGVITNNVPGVRIYEENYWKAPNIDVWGISDLDLLLESHELFAQQKGPFAAVILTAGFHRPFTVPDNVDGFDYSVPDDAFLEHYGFTDGAAEYRSLRFTDFALQRFFELARNADYYENTIFVVLGDHGVSERSPAAGNNYQNMQLHAFQVPLIIHSPLLGEPRVLPQAGGHIDVFPTVAGLAGIPYTNSTLGRDLLDPAFGNDRLTFIQRLPHMGPCLLNAQQAYSLDLPADAQELHAFSHNSTLPAHLEGQDWQPENTNSQEPHPIQNLGNSLLETSRWLLYHNQKALVDTSPPQQHPQQ